jgi:preprotein translocase subunit SecE
MTAVAKKAETVRGVEKTVKQGMPVRKTEVARVDEKVRPAKKAAKPVRRPEAAKDEVKKPNKLVRYYNEVRAELRKVIWPSRREATNLTLIVLAVTAAMSVFLGLIDWLLTQLFTLIIG